MIGGVVGLSEGEWPRACLRTRGLDRRSKGTLALNGFPIETGEIAVGDAVQFANRHGLAQAPVSAPV